MNTRKLKQKMQEKGMSCYTLSKASGVHNATVCRIVNGEIKDPKVGGLKRIADALGCRVDDLL